jgi:hypothetical protein
MKLLGGILVLIVIVFGFLCVWAACEGGYEMITLGAESRADLIGNWFMIVIVFLTGMCCFAVAPVIINEM